MCVGANMSEDMNSNSEWLVIALNKNSIDGTIESDNALKRSFFFPTVIHSTQ